ncbi:hypothetical protein DNTS_016502 [Danionella cerebrum]|uniref:MARVEL domain-containing protein n=1 Tax=Danionella cerebrum TaxID=2873325 RepID=A0A553RIT3_9TELE|nr:hypothetical protein DNTS_016502 [Danionella translucida]
MANSAVNWLGKLLRRLQGVDETSRRMRAKDVKVCVLIYRSPAGHGCCLHCLAAVPFTSLLATLLCFAGVALFCAGGHEALAHTYSFIEVNFSRDVQDFVLLADFIKYFQYVIYGLASFFFLYGVILLAEGFYTTNAVKQKFGDFRSTRFGRCISLTFIILTYLLAVIWLIVFGFTALPFYVTYYLYVCAFAGAGITLLALFVFMVATTYNYAVLRFLRRRRVRL